MKNIIRAILPLILSYEDIFSSKSANATKVRIFVHANNLKKNNFRDAYSGYTKAF